MQRRLAARRCLHPLVPSWKCKVSCGWCNLSVVDLMSDNIMPASIVAVAACDLDFECSKLYSAPHQLVAEDLAHVLTECTGSAEAKEEHEEGRSEDSDSEDNVLFTPELRSCLWNRRQRSCGTLHSTESAMDMWGNFSPLSERMGQGQQHHLPSTSTRRAGWWQDCVSRRLVRVAHLFERAGWWRGGLLRPRHGAVCAASSTSTSRWSYCTSACTTSTSRWRKAAECILV